MKYRFWLVALALAANMWAGNSPVCAQSVAGKIRAVISDGEAYLPGPVQMVTPAQTNQVIVHPQGRYALVVQNEAALPPLSVNGPTTGSVSLFLYDAHTGKTKTLWEQKANGIIQSAFVNRVVWLPGTDGALVVVGTNTIAPTVASASGSGVWYPTSTLLLFDFRKSLTGRALHQLYGSVELSVSPRKPVAYARLIVANENREESRFVTVRGTFPFARPKENFEWEQWNEDGTGIYIGQFVLNPDPNAKEKKIVQYSEWNAETGVVTPLPALPAQPAPKLPPALLPIRAVSAAPLALAAREKTASIDTLRPLYLEAADTAAPGASNRSVLLAPHAEKSWLLPDKSAVLYEANGALYAVPLVRMKAAAFADAQKAAYRLAAGDQANQVGKAILVYSMDYDERLPPQAGLANALKPYLKDAEILNGFTYVTGGSRLSIKSPETTALGYVSAPGGRAIVYADGHVKWENDK